jgi:antitoxin MazE
MLTRVQKWGNSQGLRFSKAILKEAQVSTGDEVKVSVRGRNIIIEPIDKARRKYDLKKLVLKMPKNYKAREVDWGHPVGKEAW